MTERRPPPMTAVAVAPRCRRGYTEERSERNLQGISNRRPADQAVRHGTGRPQRSDPDGRVVVLFLLPPRPGTPPVRYGGARCGERGAAAAASGGRRGGDGGGAAAARRQRSSASSKGRGGH